MSWLRAAVLPCLILVAVTITYWNHFPNEFHFDDFHSVVRNPAIREISNIPKYFLDARLFSIFPPNQSYRPMTTTTLAIDYALGGGYNPVYFHLTTFLAFLLQLVVMGALFQKILGSHRQAWLGVALYGLHPVGAETINYVIQRADMYVALGLSAGMLLYAYNRPRWALLVFALAYFFKPSALVFPGLVLAYEHFLGQRAYKKSIPFILLAAVLTVLNTVMTPASFLLGSSSSSLNYRLTQPYIAMTYLWESVAPFHLAADNEFPPFDNLLDPKAVAGYVCLLGLLVAIYKGKPTLSFGLSWFLMAMVPTSLAPLGDVTNDHRMFGPYVGLALAVASLASHRVVQLLLALALPLLAYGTVLRNQAWRSEESLWRDAVAKRPGNGRAWLNLGVCLLGHNRPAEALAAMLEAKRRSDSYVYLEVNLGQVYAALNRPEKAEQHFIRATEVDPGGTPLYLYGEFLMRQGRPTEGIPYLVESNKRNPRDSSALRLLHSYYDFKDAECKRNPTCQNYVDFSLLLFQGEEYEKAATMALAACRIDPKSAPAHNNLAACYLAQKKWAEAKKEASIALKIQPDMAVAQRNLDKANEHLGKQ